MTVWVVSRHPGATDWLRRRLDLTSTRVVAHLDASAIEPGDRIIGTLPVQAVAEIWARGAIYYHLMIPMPADRRGQELTATDLDGLGARLACFYAEARRDYEPVVNL